MPTPLSTQSNIKYFLAGTLVAFSLANAQYSEPTLLPSEFYDVDSYLSQGTFKYSLPQYEYTFALPDPNKEQPDVEPLVNFPVLKKLKVKISRVSTLEFSSVENIEGFI